VRRGAGVASVDRAYERESEYGINTASEEDGL
jgi:hypothetical protein